MKKHERPQEFELTEQPHPVVGVPSAGENLFKTALEQAERLEQSAADAEASLRKIRDANDQAKRKLLLSLIENVMDNLDRSLDGVDEHKFDDAAKLWFNRLKRARRTMEQLLAKEQVVPIDFAGAPDGLVHTRDVEERDDVPEGTIVEVDYRGYYWRGELLRKASVVRAKNSASSRAVTIGERKESTHG